MSVRLNLAPDPILWLSGASTVEPSIREKGSLVRVLQPDGDAETEGAALATCMK